MRNPLPDKLDHLHAQCRLIAPHIPDLESAPATLTKLQTELSWLNSRIDSARKTLAKERCEFDLERRRGAKESELEDTLSDLEQRDRQADVAEARAQTVRLQNLAAAEARKLEGIVKEIKKLERQLMFPHAVPVGGG
jgi:chromosome segregation ATPase